MNLSDTHNAAKRCFWQDVKEASSPSQSGRKAPRKGGRDLGVWMILWPTIVSLLGMKHQDPALVWIRHRLRFSRRLAAI